MAALQSRITPPGIRTDRQVGSELPALYQEYLRRTYGAQPAVPLITGRNGGGWEGPADAGGDMLEPMCKDTAETELETGDEREFVEYQDILGDDAPKSLAEFQDLKYNRSKEWDNTKCFAEYIQKYPTSDKRCFSVQEQAFVLPTGKYDPYHIMDRMMERNITDDEIRSYMRDAKIMIVQWGGQRRLFIGEKGTCVVVKDGDVWRFKTAWKSCDNDESSDYTMEAIKNAGL